MSCEVFWTLHLASSIGLGRWSVDLLPRVFQADPGVLKVSRLIVNARIAVPSYREFGGPRREERAGVR